MFHVVIMYCEKKSQQSEYWGEQAERISLKVELLTEAWRWRTSLTCKYQREEHFRRIKKHSKSAYRVPGWLWVTLAWLMNGKEARSSLKSQGGAINPSTDNWTSKTFLVGPRTLHSFDRFVVSCACIIHWFSLSKLRVAASSSVKVELCSWRISNL